MHLSGCMYVCEVRSEGREKDCVSVFVCTIISLSGFLEQAVHVDIKYFTYLPENDQPLNWVGELKTYNFATFWHNLDFLRSWMHKYWYVIDDSSFSSNLVLSFVAPSPVFLCDITVWCRCLHMIYVLVIVSFNITVVGLSKGNNWEHSRNKINLY